MLLFVLTTTSPLPASAMTIPAPARDAYRMGDGEGSEWLNDSAWAEVFEARSMMTGLSCGARCNTRLLSYRGADIDAQCFA
jgi:hypothetical protein